jgi:hypothetical protein
LNKKKKAKKSKAKASSSSAFANPPPSIGMGLLELAKGPVEVKRLEMQQLQTTARLAQDLMASGFTPAEAKEILFKKP